MFCYYNIQNKNFKHICFQRTFNQAQGEIKITQCGIETTAAKKTLFNRGYIYNIDVPS